MIFDVTSNKQQISMSRLVYHSFSQDPLLSAIGGQPGSDSYSFRKCRSGRSLDPMDEDNEMH